MNILVIGDLHAPFIDKDAFNFVKSVEKAHEIDEVIFMGDIVDNHATSYHESDPDGHSAGLELTKAIIQLGEWHDYFKYAKVCEGNHDSLVKRKAKTGGVSKRWVKELAEVLEVDTWDIKSHHEIGNFFFSHGLGQLVHTRAKDLGKNCVSGHIHSKFEARYDNGLWSIYSGSLTDDESYAMAYCKWGKKTKRGVVVIIDADSPNPLIKMIRMDEWSKSIDNPLEVHTKKPVRIDVFERKMKSINEELELYMFNRIRTDEMSGKNYKYLFKIKDKFKNMLN